MTLAYVEATLVAQHLKRRPDCLVLSCLYGSGHGPSHALGVTYLLGELADGIGNVSPVTSLIVRYVQARRL
jgi:hypothetical protein